jgi:endonuclease/exonuclease/phosphatase family metal-dependent hydrolase
MHESLDMQDCAMKSILLRALISPFLFLIILTHIYADSPDRLKILSINVWSGVDYKGIWRFGEYESAERREERFNVLVEQIRTLDPDIVFVQEAIFLDRYLERLAGALSFEQINQVVNAGIKFGSVGPPVNFKEGIAILARPSLRIEKSDAWKLSGSPGIHSSFLTLHFDESVLALVGKVYVNKTPVYLVNVHLHATPPRHPAIEERLNDFRKQGVIDDRTYDRLIARWQKGIDRRHREVKRLLRYLNKLPAGAPVIVAGDFNATPESDEMNLFKGQGHFIDTYELGVKNRGFTWDPVNNPNVVFSTRPMLDMYPDAHADELLPTAGDLLQRRIDYIFLNSRFREEDILYSAVVIDSSIGNVYASDHYGMFTEIDIAAVRNSGGPSKRIEPLSIRPKMEFLPIAVYDTDIGFGYGGKAFFLNYLGGVESFDAIAFNSTKGERWFRFVFSVPDREVRQKKIYPFAFDLIADYETQIRKNFFGIGHASIFDDREYFSQQEIDVRTIFSKGISERIVVRSGVRYGSVNNYHFEEESRLAISSPSLNGGRVRYFSLHAGLRYDSRNSHIHPSRGFVLSGDLEYAPAGSFSNVEFLRTSTWLQYYHVLFYPKTVLAFRIGQKSVFGNELPMQVLSSLGGVNSLRGYPANRFLDRLVLISNCEVRFPLYRRLGGVVGIDAGSVAKNTGEIFSGGIVTNQVVGLRYQMDLFVVRVDAGFGKETMGLYFNFGHTF